MHGVTIRKKAMISQPMIVTTNLTAEQLKNPEDVPIQEF